MSIELRPEIPAILYKHRTLNSNNLNIISDRQIYFSSPKKFNDPFDCSIPIRFDKLTENEHSQFAFELLKDLYPKKNDAEIISFIKDMKSKGVFRTKESFKEMVYFQLKRLHDELGILSLSKSKGNLLLWSHYSDNHRGFCIGFDSLGLYKDTKAGIGRVEYLAEYPEIEFSGSGNMNDLIVQFLSKSVDWEYECEFRFTYFGGANKLFQIRNSTIKEIILGCQIPVKNKEIILRLIENDKELNHVEVYQAEKNKNEFKLEFQPLELS